MAIAIVQDGYAEVGFPQTVEMDSAPTPGNLVLVWQVLRELTISLGPPNGFTAHPDGPCMAGTDSGLLAIREAEAGDTDTITGFDPGSMVYWAELSGVDSWEWGDSHDDATSDPISTDVLMAGAGWGLLGLLWRTPTDTATEAITPTDGAVELNDAKIGAGLAYHPLSWVAYIEAASDGGYNVNGDPNTALTHWWGGHLISLYEGGDLPEPPPVDPGYTPPDPGHAILEIYVHDEDATRWDTATWSADDIPTGTEGIWSGEGWQDVTPQGVTAHVSWGSSRPERGILALQESQSWLVTTYDPDRKLDPGNESSPWAPQLVSGVPIRISSSSSGLVIRTGLIDRISYQYKAPDYRGQISASSTIAALWRADVPEDSILGDTLRERIIDAVVASGIFIGGVAITGFDDSYPDIALSPQIPDAQKVWTHIYKAAEEVGWVVYEDEHGTLQARPYTNPADRGAQITYANLEDLKAESSEDGIYSVVYVTNEDGSAVIERVAAPLPRFGRIPYTRQETTIDPEGFADAVLADRSWPGVVWTPGTVWCFTQADVDFMADLEIMERVNIVVPGVVDITGRLLGMEMWVESIDEDETRWLFLPRIGTDGGAAIGTTILVADDNGDYLVDDEGDGEYLELEG